MKMQMKMSKQFCPGTEDFLKSNERRLCGRTQIFVVSV